MDLLALIERKSPPGDWVEGEKIPWNDPDFSRRMLQEHLSQAHDAASRRFATIDRHVQWIHQQVLGAQRTKILDLACGPGLYASRLTALGHEVQGIDFSPASIEYAREQAAGNSPRYVQADVREADYGSGFGLAMLIFGEFNVFRREDAALILRKAHAALDEGGQILLEPHTFDIVREMGQEGPFWYSAASGLFSERPHLYLSENFWNEDARTATTRYFIVDAATAAVTRYASTMQAYTEADYRMLLNECGFGDVAFFNSLAGNIGSEAQPGLCALLARKSS